MDLAHLGVSGGRRKALIVLGAGASRGASFAADPTSVLPPLDADFFQQLSRMRQTDESRRLLRFVREEFGSEVGLSMEEFFSQADYTDRFHSELNVDPGPHVRKYAAALEDFMVLLPRVLHASIGHHVCSHHAQLARALRAADCVITYNYDCIMDRALVDEAGVRWDPDAGGYGFPITTGGKSWKTHGPGRPPRTPIQLLKMHGSMNWHISRRRTVSLIGDLGKIVSLKDAIIPPTWFKDLEVEPFASVWKAARKEIRTSRIMIVIGYSVPPTDLFSRSLFKVEAGSKAKRERLDLAVLVNPDKDARRRFLNLIRGGIESTTTVLEYEKLEELSRVLKRHGV